MNHTMTVMQHGEHFELRIDNVSFSHLHAQQQTKDQFVYDRPANRNEPSGQSEAGPKYGNSDKFDWGKSGGGGGSSSSSGYNYPNGRPMEGFGNRDIRQGSGSSYGKSYTSSYTVRHVPKTGGPPKRRNYYGPGQSNLGANAIARGWDDVAEAKNQAFSSGYEDDDQ